MSLTDSAFPASAVFDKIAAYMDSPSAAKSAIASTKAIVHFQLRNSQGVTQSWFIDLKKSGKVGRGTAPEGEKATVNLMLSDADFGSLVEGKANAQKMFMNGKLKVKGDVMKAGKIEPVLKKARDSGKARL